PTRARIHTTTSTATSSTPIRTPITTMSTSSTNTPTPTMTGPSTLILICTKPGSKRSTSTPTTSARQLPAGGHSDVGAVVLRIASLVERRQVAGGRLHQSSVGRNPAVGTVEAG